MQRPPTSHEWQTIQEGGEPWVLQSPSGVKFEIVHLHNGAVVETPRDQMMESLGGSALLHLNVHTEDDVIVPATLLWAHHGEPCENRSGQGAGSYNRVDPAAHVEQRLSQGWLQRTLRLPS